MYDIDELYESGKMPEVYYSQMNGKSAIENYKRQMKKRQKKYKEYKEKKDESILFQMVRDTLSGVTKEALKTVLQEINNRF